MISNDAIIEWQAKVGFASSLHAEQDLVLSRLIVEIADDEFLGEELVFRGGTCLHKLHLPKPLRYSEEPRLRAFNQHADRTVHRSAPRDR